jgi:hypothetical protein
MVDPDATIAPAARYPSAAKSESLPKGTLVEVNTYFVYKEPAETAAVLDRQPPLAVALRYV